MATCLSRYGPGTTCRELARVRLIRHYRMGCAWRGGSTLHPVLPYATRLRVVAPFQASNRCDGFGSSAPGRSEAIITYVIRANVAY